jgi:hypothetical protein
MFRAIRQITRLLTMASAAYMAYTQLRNAYKTLQQEWKKQKQNEQYGAAGNASYKPV